LSICRYKKAGKIKKGHKKTPEKGVTPGKGEIGGT
jgi:hypothetical protein